MNISKTNLELKNQVKKLLIKLNHNSSEFFNPGNSMQGQLSINLTKYGISYCLSKIQGSFKREACTEIKEIFRITNPENNKDIILEIFYKDHFMSDSDVVQVRAHYESFLSNLYNKSEEEIIAVALLDLESAYKRMMADLTASEKIKFLLKF